MTRPLRIAVIDIARTIALIAMALFHFTYDLELFGFAPSGTMARTEWIVFSWIIAGSFIFLSGVSLVLAALHGSIHWGKYIKRLAMIGLAAGAVSAGTYLAMGGAFVRFGILHHLFAASLLGLLFLNRAFWIAGLVGALLLSLPHLPVWPLFDATIWLWLGQTKATLPPMVDYIPLLPWFGMFLLGMSFAQGITRLHGWPHLARLVNPDAGLARLLVWPGQHSLAIYLIHQPVLFGGVYLARLLLGQ